MPTALCLIRNNPSYPHGQFADGLKRLGFRVTDRIGDADLLVTWNRMGSRNEIAKSFERRGRPVIVAENGWIGRTASGGKFYSMCLGHHNGVGQWQVGIEDRFPLLHVKLSPWREAGRKLVILASRGIGEPGVAQPHGWPERTLAALKRRTNRPVEIRRHPGDSHADIGESLKDTHAVVTWASGAAIKSIAAGIPAFYELPSWVGASAASFVSCDLEKPFLGDRTPMFHKLAWAQWAADEIADGTAFEWLLKSRSTASPVTNAR